jgi:hypothetical protein
VLLRANVSSPHSERTGMQTLAERLAQSSAFPNHSQQESP